MAFELIFSFRTKDSSEKQTFKKVIGKPEEDVPLETVLNTIIGQFARRDRLVESVEIHEFVKKKIKFKEIKGGFIIKDKKFILDEGFTLTNSVSNETVEEVKQQEIHKVPQIIRFEIYDPDPMMLGMLSRKYKLTPKRKYPILEEKTVIQNINDTLTGTPTQIASYEYLVTDDLGQNVRIGAINFVPEQKGLIGMPNTQLTEQQYKDAPKLMHMENYPDMSMPVLRR